MEDYSNRQNVNGDRLIGSDCNSLCGPVDYNCLKLNLGAEFDDWQEFVEAVEEFQKKTRIRLTITTSRRVQNGEDEDDPTGEERISIENETNTCESESSSINRKRRKFQYKYLKLTCKHYGCYRSTSKGIRPNQPTRKIKCPTYIYASLDHYRQRLVIKQMKVNCNHELKDDEQVLFPKLFRFSPFPDNPPSSSNESSDCSPIVSSPSKTTCKTLIVPLRSSVNELLTSGKIGCDHRAEDVCQAIRLTPDDLTAIQTKFSSLNKKDQDDLLSNWIKVENNVTENRLKQPNPLQLLIHLPTINGNLLPLCCDTFIHILSIPIQRINDLICEQLRKTSHREISIKIVKESQSNQESDRQIIPTTILNSQSKETNLQDNQIYSINLNHNNQRPNQFDRNELTQSHNSPSNTNEITSDNLITLGLSSSSVSTDNQVKSKQINDSTSLTNNLLMDTTNQSNNFRYPSIKVSQIVNGFSVDIDCEFQMNLQGVSLINNSQTVKLIIEPE